MKKKTIAIGLLLLFLSSQAYAGKKTVNLMSGIGVKGGLKLGENRGKNGSAVKKWKQEIIDKIHDISYMTDSRNDVALIRCDKPSCITDHGIRVGTNRSEILKRYGSPKIERKIAAGEYYEYEGVGFEINSQDTVTAILIFPK